MKKLLAVFLFVAASMPLMANAETKIGIINFGEVMAKVPQKDAINQKLKKEFSGRENELKRLGEEIETARTEYINNVATMSESQATEKKRAIQQKMSDFQLKEAAFKDTIDLYGQACFEAGERLEKLDKPIYLDGEDIDLENIENKVLIVNDKNKNEEIGI